MASPDSKYRGTKSYVLVQEELVRAAQYRGLTTYQDIALIMGLPPTGHRLAREAGQILDEISNDEVQAGRPMLSAVAVGVSGKPGRGFFELAKRLRKLSAGDDEQAFWVRERDAAYSAWRRQ